MQADRSQLLHCNQRADGFNRLEEIKEKKCGKTQVCLGEVEVITVVTGFKKKAQYTEETLGEEPLDLPPRRLCTVAYGLT